MEFNEVFFNELCLKEKPDYTLWENLVKVKTMLSKKGFSGCRISSDRKELLRKYVEDIKNRTIKNIIYSFFRTEYEPSEIEKDNILAEKFLSHNYSYKGQDIIGFAWADFLETFAISFHNSKEWNHSIISIAKDSREVCVHHVSTTEHIVENVEWIEQREDSEPSETDILPANKKYHVRDDHGIDELEGFWNRIKNSKYVISCVNSLKWSPYNREFIRRFFPDGLIEITLPWTDKGFGMLIQTTGKNIRETQKIAEILKEKYSK